MGSARSEASAWSETRGVSEDIPWLRVERERVSKRSPESRIGDQALLPSGAQPTESEGREKREEVQQGTRGWAQAVAT